MNNNLFYSRENTTRKKNKIDFKQKKENTLTSLNEVENFLLHSKHFMRYVKLYKFFK